MEWEADEALGRLLEAIRDAPFGSESIPDVPGISHDEAMDLVQELIERGWVSADHLNRGDGRLASVWNPRITPPGNAALKTLRLRALRRKSGSSSGTPKPIGEKRRMRLEFMRHLYELTDGSQEIAIAASDLARALGWDESDADKVVDYLWGEDLLDVVAFGPQVSITHKGVVEVEEAVQHPTRPTQHFPAINITNVQTMIHSQIQQGNVSSEQAIVVDQPALEEIKNIIKEIRELLPDLELSRNDLSELEAEIDTADRQLQSPRPKDRVITDTLARARDILVTASALAGSSEHLAAVVERLHRALPGV